VAALTATKIKSIRAGVIAIILLSLVSVPLLQNTQAQNATTFLPNEKFNIPERNGSISFSLNGSYASATLENGTWSFNDLRLNNSLSLGNLKVSAQNSIITITSYRSSTPFGRSQFIRYMVQGQGIQTVNFDLNYTKPTQVSEWTVYRSPNIFLSLDQGWNLLPNDTIVLISQTGNVSVIHYRFDLPDDSNLPFYLRHSIALITIVVVVATILVAVLITFKMRK
jgi:hypothetical protein